MYSSGLSRAPKWSRSESRMTWPRSAYSSISTSLCEAATTARWKAVSASTNASRSPPAQARSR